MTNFNDKPRQSPSPQGMLTRGELTETAKRRLSAINTEFKRAFEFIGQFKKSVTMFGSTRINENNPHYIKAQKLAKKLSLLGYTIVTGGGPGIMEAANRGAFEARGKSVGLTIELPRRQLNNKFLTDRMDFYYFFTRKVALSFAAEAYLFFPGGFGTLDEFFEIVTLVQTSKIRPVPIILIGKDYWDNLRKFLKKDVLDDHQAISPNDLNLFTITDDDEEILKIVREAPVV